MNYLEAHHLVKQYSTHLALNDVSIAVPRGTVYGLLGPNGAGKTTLIRIINRITAPDQGEVFIEGRPFTQQDVFNIGYLPEERGLYKKMKTMEQALFLAQLKGLSKQESKKRINYWFEKFDILSWKNKKVEELSKGMQQKIQFIAAIIHDPDLLIFDEPFSGFDPVNAELLKKEILELKAKGKTIILSTHNMESVETLCDEITLINQSEVVLQGNVTEIRKKHQEQLLKLVVLNTYKQEETIFIKKKNEESNSDLLAPYISKYEILSFEEILPTMNDIFIQTVKKNQL